MKECNPINKVLRLEKHLLIIQFSKSPFVKDKERMASTLCRFFFPLATRPTIKDIRTVAVLKKIGPQADEQIVSQECFQILSKVQKFFESFIIGKGRNPLGTIRLDFKDLPKLLELVQGRISAESLQGSKSVKSHTPEPHWSELTRELIMLFDTRSHPVNTRNNSVIIQELVQKTDSSSGTKVENHLETRMPITSMSLQRNEPNSPLDEVEQLLLLFPDFPQHIVKTNRPFIILKDRTVARLDPEPVWNYYSGTDLESLRELHQAQRLDLKLKSKHSLRRLIHVLPYLCQLQQIAISLPGYAIHESNLSGDINPLAKGIMDLIRVCGRSLKLKGIKISRSINEENHIWEGGDEAAINLLRRLPKTILHIQYKHLILRPIVSCNRFGHYSKVYNTLIR
jgi:hypothetical protein